MKKSNTAKIVGLLALICGLVAVFFWFGNAFDEDGHQYNLIQTAFAIEDHQYPTLWPMVIGFVVLAVGALTSGLVPFFEKTGSIALGALSFVFLLAGGIMTLLVKVFFMMFNPYTNQPWTDFGLGAGTITSAVFAFIAALLVLVMINMARKSDVAED